MREEGDYGKLEFTLRLKKWMNLITNTYGVHGYVSEGGSLFSRFQRLGEIKIFTRKGGKVFGGKIGFNFLPPTTPPIATFSFDS